MASAEIEQAVDRLRCRKTAEECKRLVKQNGVTPCAQTAADTMDKLRDAMQQAAISKSDAKTEAKPDAKTEAKPKSGDKGKS